MKLQVKGKISKWNVEKGFGFITPTSGGKQVFVHVKAIKRRHQRPQLGQVVSYSVGQDKLGRVCATDVTYVGQQQESSRRIGQKIATVTFATLFFAVLSIFTFAFQFIPLFIIPLYAAASAITFIAYAIDKSAAQNGRWRTAEATLHTLALFGGWPGALLAQQTLRHKTRKVEFQWIFRSTVILNVAISAWLLNPRGPELTVAFLEKMLKIMDG